MEKNESGKKLVVFLTDLFKGEYSSRALKKMIEENCCEVNGKTERFASTLVYENDRIKLHPPKVSFKHSSSDEKERILYEDDFLFIYNKPEGITCDEKGLLRLFPNLLLVHRLDKETTGALLFAKQPQTFQKMVDLFRHYAVKKKYLAIVDGEPARVKGKIENHLGKKSEFSGQTLWGEVPASKGLFASTEWQKIKSNHFSSLLACFPLTGRTHQLRVHLSAMGHPLLGDFQYGKAFISPFRPSRYLLHAKELSFLHPFTKKPLHIFAPLAEDFAHAIDALFEKGKI